MKCRKIMLSHICKTTDILHFTFGKGVLFKKKQTIFLHLCLISKFAKYDNRFYHLLKQTNIIITLHPLRNIRPNRRIGPIHKIMSRESLIFCFIENWSKLTRSEDLLPYDCKIYDFKLLFLNSGCETKFNEKRLSKTPSNKANALQLFLKI